MSFWSKSKPPTHTNAPRHWPVVHFEQWENPGLNLLQLGAQLAPLHAPPASTLSFMRSFAYEDGILEAPLMVEEGGQKTCIFLYSVQDKDAAAHYSGARALLKTRENIAAVYYAPEALAPAKPAAALKPIDTPMFSKPNPPPENATFALWWATPDDPVFSQSEDRSLLDRWFEALSGYGHLLFTAFAHDLDLVEKKEKMHTLPEQPLLQPLTAPGDVDVLLHASAREGVFLAFDEKTTSRQQRRVLLKLLADFAGSYRKAIGLTAGQPQSNDNSLETWRRIRDEALKKEATGGAGIRVHAVQLRDGQPIRSPGATTTDDTRIPMLSNEELDWAMLLIDRVVAGMRKRPVGQSSQEELGHPNIFPVIAGKAGGHTWERRLPYEDAGVAQATAARALDEWPDAELVAVLVDGAIRENDTRVDVLDMKVQNSAGVAVDVIQRYRTSGGGELELVGTQTVRRSEPFLLPRTPQPDKPAGPGVQILADGAVDEIVKKLRAGEPTGIVDEAPEDPLTAPSALIGTADGPPRLVRFMLQGPVTARMSCIGALEYKKADWVVFFIDDLVTKDGEFDRRLRLYIQRRGDPATAIVDQRYEQPSEGRPFALRGSPEFKRWTVPLLP